MCTYVLGCVCTVSPCWGLHHVSQLCHNTTRDQSAVWPAQCGIYLSILLQTWETAKCYVLLNVEEGTNKSTDKLFLYPPVLAACPWAAHVSSKLKCIIVWVAGVSRLTTLVQWAARTVVTWPGLRQWEAGEGNISVCGRAVFWSRSWPRMTKHLHLNWWWRHAVTDREQKD